MPGDSGIKPVTDAGPKVWLCHIEVRGRRSGADHPDSSGARGRGINHLASPRPRGRARARTSPDGAGWVQRFFATLKVSLLLRWVNVARPAPGELVFRSE